MFDFLFPKKLHRHISAYFEAVEVDIHSHLLPAIDDGSPNLDVSMQLIRQMCELGFKKIITTPHISELYPNNGDSVLDGLYKVNRQLKVEGIKVELTVGAEYMINDIFEQLIISDEPLLTLPNKHILVEMPHLSEPVNLYKVLSLLKSKGYTPVLAHPERYRFYNKNLTQYEKLKDYGCLFQVNMLSMVGYYGSAVSDCAWLLLNEEMIDFIGSDLHHQRHIEAINNGMNTACQRILNYYPFKNKSLFGRIVPQPSKEAFLSEITEGEKRTYRQKTYNNEK